MPFFLPNFFDKLEKLFIIKFLYCFWPKGFNPPRKMLERERKFPRNHHYFGMVFKWNLLGLMKWLVLKIEQSCQELCVICEGHQKPIALQLKVISVSVSVETHWKPPHGNFCGKSCVKCTSGHFQSQCTTIKRKSHVIN